MSSIIVTAGKNDYFIACLDSLAKQSYYPIEIIIIDNSLNYDVNGRIKKVCPLAKVYFSPRNLFYCEALNKGISLSNGIFVLCLNDDVVLDKNFVSAAVRGFYIDERVGMVSGKIMRTDKKTIDSTGLFLSRWRTAKERGYGLRDAGRFEKEEYVFGVNGAVAFYRKRMLEKIKINSEYFDSDFCIFYEDLDIAWRARNFGWQAYYIPQAIAYHARGGTARGKKGIGKSFARRYLDDDLCADLIKNRWLAIIKNETWLGFLSFWPFIVLYDCAAAAYLIFFRPKVMKKLIAGILKYARSALNKRKLLSRYHYCNSSVLRSACRSHCEPRRGAAI